MKKDKTRYIIIGNSTAGIAAASNIRQVDREGALSIISDEKYINYSRPLISYLLGGRVTKERMLYCDKSFYEENKIDLLLSKKVTGIDISKFEIILSDGKRLIFDRLLIATGGEPIMPDIKTLDLEGVFTFTRLPDAERIKKYIEEKKIQEAVVLGGGLIGLKATEALMDLGIKVAIIELADRILSATFDKRASCIIEAALKKRGCSVVTNNTAVEARGEKGVEEMVLKDKNKLKARMIIIAIGVKPNIGLVKNTSIKVNKGIIVDNFMQTNVPGIYAAGDVCEADDALYGIKRPIAIWPNAYRQGEIAGYNMAGERKEYEGGIVMNSVELCGIPTISVGITAPQGEGFEILEDYNEKDSVYKKVVLKDNIIVGAVFVGGSLIDRAGVYTGLIKNKMDTRSFKEHLLKEDFGLVYLPVEYRKHMVQGAGIEI